MDCQNARLLQFMDVVGSRRDLCPPRKSAAQFFFNPYAESPDLLREWLEYRGVRARGGSLADLAARDMRSGGTGKHFADFVFTPWKASDALLQQWLSWWGVGGEGPRKRWLRMAERIQRRRRSWWGKRRADRKTFSFRDLVDVQAALLANRNYMFCIGDALSVLTEEEFGALLKGSRIKLRADGKRAALDYKRLLAFFLGASAVSIPIVWNTKRHAYEWLRSSALQARTVFALIRKSNKLAQKLLVRSAATYALPRLALATGVPSVLPVGKAAVEDILSAQGFPEKTITALLDNVGESAGKAFLTDVLVPAIGQTIKEETER